MYAKKKKLCSKSTYVKKKKCTDTFEKMTALYALPFDIQEIIFAKKHTMEMKECFDTIKATQTQRNLMG